MLPIRDDNPARGRAYVTIAIIALNLVAFLFWEPTFASGPLASARANTFFYCHAEIPFETTQRTTLADGGAAARRAIARSEVLPPGATPRDLQRYLEQRCPNKSWWMSVFTAMFLHAGWLHIGGNMLFLWVFGNNVEDRLGRLRYLLFYLAAGLVATLAQVATNPSSALPNLGASGAIAGVLGAYLVMFPRRKVLTLVFFFIITFVYLPAVAVLGAWFVLQAFSGVAALSEHVHTGGVAFFAHIDGFAFGALMALLFFPKEGFSRRPPPIRPDLPARGLWWRKRPLPPAPRPDLQ